MNKLLVTASIDLDWYLDSEPELAEMGFTAESDEVKERAMSDLQRTGWVVIDVAG